jgi:hypothetical protein
LELLYVVCKAEKQRKEISMALGINFLERQTAAFDVDRVARKRRKVRSD